MIDLKNRLVLFFRAHIDPGIGPSPKLAVHSKDNKKIELTPAGIYVCTLNGEEHLVPYTNIQSIKLSPAEEKK